jgi:hypothetical protein
MQYALGSNLIAGLRRWPLEDVAMDGRNAQIADIARRLAEGSIDYLPTVPELMQDGVWPFALQYANDRLDERVDLLSLSKGRP